MAADPPEELPHWAVVHDPEAMEDTPPFIWEPGDWDDE